jgi:hypothetical protein
VDVWKLYAGDELVADLVVTGLDDPWLLARVEPGPALDRYRPLFEAELRDAAHRRRRGVVALDRPVPGVGLEPTMPIRAALFKSAGCASSPTRADATIVIGLATLATTQLSSRP